MSGPLPRAEEPRRSPGQLAINQMFVAVPSRKRKRTNQVTQEVSEYERVSDRYQKEMEDFLEERMVADAFFEEPNLSTEQKEQSATIDNCDVVCHVIVNMRGCLSLYVLFLSLCVVFVFMCARTQNFILTHLTGPRFEKPTELRCRAV